MSKKAKKAGNLVALGSAAVVAVYGAGFMRTAAAAERFAEQSDERVLAPEDAAAAQSAPKAAATLSNVNDSNAIASAARPSLAPTKSPPAKAPNKADATVATVDAKTKAASTSSTAPNGSTPVPPELTTVNSSSGAAPAHVAATAVAPVVVPGSAATADTKPVAEKASSPVAITSVAVTPTPVTAPVPAPVVAPVPPAPVVPAATAPIVAAPAAPPVTAPVAVTSTEAAVVAPAVPKLKDGEYTGYGTSRHGDVEVYLETTDGKITYVKISQCLTQYSCSWISDLPKQVLTRQSARVDGVSGATQSANAFYYAVVQALAKAK